MKRFHVTVGGSTSVGGVVISANSTMSIMGKKVAVEGDQIQCPKCGSLGQIRCVPPRLNETVNGRPPALADDLCICGCTPPPKLIANQTIRCQVIGSSSSETMVAGGQGGQCKTGAAFHDEQTLFDDRVRLVDSDTGEPLRNHEYCIRRATGELEFGITDNDGHSHLLSATMQSEAVEIFV